MRIQHRPLPATLSESDLQKVIVDYAILHRWMCHHSRPARMQSGKWATPLQGHKGLPDLILARDGVVIFAELKAERGRVSPEQRQWLEAIGCGSSHACFVWRPSDWPTIVEILR